MSRPVAPVVYDLELTPLSPIHIGADTHLEPMEFRLARRDGDGWLEVLNLTDLLCSFSDAQRAEYDKLARRADYPLLRNWVQKQARSEHVRFAIQVMEPDAWKSISKHEKNPESDCEIELMTRHPQTGRAFIPGSSIKGAIRTAIVDHALDDPKWNEYRLKRLAQAQARGGSATFEAEVLGHTKDRGGRPGADLYRDPLRQVAISDAWLPDDATYIDRVKIVKRDTANDGQNSGKTGSPDGILMHRDLTWSMADGEELRSRGELRLLPHLADERLMGGRQHAVPRTITVRDICRACNAFYIQRLQDELDHFNCDPDAADALDAAVESLESQDALSTADNAETDKAHDADGPHRDQCLIRVGRHSHFECVTVRKTLSQAPKRGAGKSRTYAAGIVPLGWARLTFTPRG